MGDFGLPFETSDAKILTSSIGTIPLFSKEVATLSKLKAVGFRLAIIPNTDDAIIAENVTQLGGHIDRVIAAEAY